MQSVVRTAGCRAREVHFSRTHPNTDSQARMMATGTHLILGGQRSGKTRYGEQLAAQWLQDSASHRALYVATAQALDATMQQRITEHQRERAYRLPGVPTLYAPLDLAHALRTHSRPDTLLLVDCLGMWLMNWQMLPPSPLCMTVAQSADGLGAAGQNHTPQAVASPGESTLSHSPFAGLLPGPSCDEDDASPPPDWPQQRAAFLHALAQCSGPVVMVSSEISLGVIPLGAQVRAYVDALGLLHQDTAAQCAVVTLMVAGLPVTVKGSCAAGK